jgi:tetratricopeptide (TPR) repeat protein
MRTLVLTAVLTLLAAAPASADDPKRARALYEEGMKYYNVGEYRKALESFKDGYFAKADPAFLFNLAQCYRMLGDTEPAIRQYRAYLGNRPDAPNREEVEHFIVELEAELKRRSAERPPMGVVAPAGTPSESQTVVPQPPATAPAATSTTQGQEKPPAAEAAKPPVAEIAAPPHSESAAPAPVYRKGWFWGVMAGALVVAGGAAALAVAETTPANASPQGDYPPVTIRF